MMQTKTVKQVNDATLAARRQSRQAKLAFNKTMCQERINRLVSMLRLTGEQEQELRDIANYSFEAGTLTAFDRPFVVLVGEEVPS